MPDNPNIFGTFKDQPHVPATLPIALSGTLIWFPCFAGISLYNSSCSMRIKGFFMFFHPRQFFYRGKLLSLGEISRKRNFYFFEV